MIPDGTPPSALFSWLSGGGGGGGLGKVDVEAEVE